MGDHPGMDVECGEEPGDHRGIAGARMVHDPGHVRQLGGAEDGGAVEFPGCRDHNAERVIAQPLAFQLRRPSETSLAHLEDQREVQLPVLAQPGDGLVRLSHVHAQGDAELVPVPGSQQLGQGIGGQGRKNADAQFLQRLAARIKVRGGGRCHERVDVGEHATGMAHHGQGRGRGFDALGAAGEKGGAGVAFQRRHLLRDRRGRVAQAQGGGGEGFLRHHFQQRAQMNRVDH